MQHIFYYKLPAMISCSQTWRYDRAVKDLGCMKRLSLKQTSNWRTLRRLWFWWFDYQNLKNKNLFIFFAISRQNKIFASLASAGKLFLSLLQRRIKTFPAVCKLNPQKFHYHSSVTYNAPDTPHVSTVSIKITIQIINSLII